MTTLVYVGTWGDDDAGAREVLPEVSLPVVSREQVVTIADAVPTLHSAALTPTPTPTPEPTVAPTPEPEPAPVVAAPTVVWTPAPVVVATVAPAPVVRAASGTYADVAYAAIKAHFAEYQYAYAVAGCETGHTYDPASVGAQGEIGILQIHPIHFAKYGRPPADIWGQVAHAARIVRDLSWSHWSCA